MVAYWAVRENKGRIVPVEDAEEVDEESSVSGEGGMLVISSSSSYSERVDSSGGGGWLDGIGGSRGRCRSLARRNSF